MKTFSRARLRRATSILLRRRWLLVVPTFVSAALALAWSVRQPSSYEARANAVVSYASVSSPEAVATAIDVMRSPETRDAVRRALDLEQPPPLPKITTPSDDGGALLVVEAAQPQLAVQLLRTYVQQADAALRGPRGIGVQLVGEPVRPISPISPRPLRDTVIAGLFGLLVGVFAARLIDRRDDRIRPGFDVEGFSGLPVLAHVPRLPVGRNGTPVSQRAEQVPEAFRSLVSSIGHLRASMGLRSLAVVGIGSHPGASTTAAAIALGVGQSGSDTVLVDGDLRSPDLHSMLNTRPSPGLVDALSSASSSLRPYRLASHLEFVPAGTTGTPGLPVQRAALASFVRSLTDDDLFVVLDSHGLGRHDDALSLVSSTDGVVVIVRSGRLRAEALAEALSAIREAGGRPVAIVVNRVGRARYRGERYRSLGGPRRRISAVPPPPPARVAEMPIPAPPHAMRPSAGTAATVLRAPAATTPLAARAAAVAPAAAPAPAPAPTSVGAQPSGTNLDVPAVASVSSVPATVVSPVVGAPSSATMATAGAPGIVTADPAPISASARPPVAVAALRPPVTSVAATPLAPAMNVGPAPSAVSAASAASSPVVSVSPPSGALPQPAGPVPPLAGAGAPPTDATPPPHGATVAPPAGILPQPAGTDPAPTCAAPPAGTALAQPGGTAAPHSPGFAAPGAPQLPPARRRRLAPPETAPLSDAPILASWPLVWETIDEGLPAPLLTPELQRPDDDPSAPELPRPSAAPAMAPPPVRGAPPVPR